MLRVEGLCLGIHGTWRAGGTDAEEEELVLCPEERSLFLEREEDQEGRCLVGNCWLARRLEESMAPDACSTPWEEIYTWEKV